MGTMHIFHDACLDRVIAAYMPTGAESTDKIYAVEEYFTYYGRSGTQIEIDKVSMSNPPRPKPKMGAKVEILVLGTTRYEGIYYGDHPSNDKFGRVMVSGDSGWTLDMSAPYEYINEVEESERIQGCESPNLPALALGKRAVRKVLKMATEVDIDSPIDTPENLVYMICVTVPKGQEG